ncbi:SPASM domain-containing protein [uncultured Prevotella sp.]|uniref:radical SAM/SPASM domain-containing protein n=2 Tax=uncultured Prevotella sp. TaxID=159272 RepID=UPI00259A7FCB|nr:SPASM domain-containing protein [uncultured Prevotella sp.]
MKRNYYQLNTKVDEDYYLYINFMNNSHVILNHEFHEMYSKTANLDLLKKQNPKLYDTLVEHGFLVNDDFDELSYIEFEKKKSKFDNSLYHIVINPTLDCNLSCWYCYEKKQKYSVISSDVIEGIKKNIVLHNDHTPFRTLKLSFFGGEPFLQFEAIKELTDFASDFCKNNSKYFVLDFTTNANLIKQDHLLKISQYPCAFQITLDGNKKQHNKIKFTKDRNIDTYQLAINNIKKILDTISNSFVAIRINFDSYTLNSFDDILEDIKDLDRKRVKIILKRIWQVNDKDIENNILLSTIQKLIDNNFLVDYYTQGGVCFGDMLNEVVVNFDGKVFKCTTIDDFNEENSYGYLDTGTGEIVWNSKISTIGYDLTKEKCKKCKLYPSCLGPCTLHLMANDDVCFIDSLNLTLQEYMMFLYKNELTRKRIFESK